MEGRKDAKLPGECPEKISLRLVRLEGQGCQRLRPLWEEVFYEDSSEFTDYYFQEKASRNHGYALINGEGPVAMLYLSPYPVMLRKGDGFLCREINYVVGVATKKEFRHRGCMDRLLRAALLDMAGKEHPFTFLMPADPAIYRPYQFAYIYGRKEYRKQEGDDRQKAEAVHPSVTEAVAEDFQALAGFAQDYLERHCDVFIRRDEAYYRTMEKELAAQRGGIRLWKEKGKLAGYVLFTRETEKEEIQEAVFAGSVGSRICPAAGTGKEMPVIMARIVHVPAMLSLLSAKGREIALCIRISDPILPDNNGIWECLFVKNGARVHRAEGSRTGSREGHTAQLQAAAREDKSGEVADITIEALAAWVFGYRKTEECFQLRKGIGIGEREKIMDGLRQIRRPKKVWINEIV